MSRPASPRAVRAEVVQVESLGDRWRRVVIDTKEAHPVLRPYFERVVDDGVLGAFNIGLFFPVLHGEAEDWPVISGPFVENILVDPSQFGDPAVARVTRRKYTVRAADETWRRLELNFVMLGDGLAMNWAERAEVGMPLLIDLGGRVVDASHLPPVDTYLLLGDETAVPSIATILERLPASARAFVAVEVADAGDEWTFDTEAKATIDWIHRGDAEPGTTDFLIDYCTKFDWPTEGVHVWAAAEGIQIRALRSYLRNEVGLQRGQFELMGYWRRGVRTEQLITVEAEAVNGALAAGEDMFAGLARLRPADQGQDRTTPYENFDVH